MNAKKACERCGKEYPITSYMKKDKRRVKQYTSKICNQCRRKQEAERRREPDEQVSPPPVVLSLPHYETCGPSELWPRGRLFARVEFEGDLKDGIWPTGLVVKNERGKRFIVEGTELIRV